MPTTEPRVRAARPGEPRCAAHTRKGARCGNRADLFDADPPDDCCLLHSIRPDRIEERAAYQGSRRRVGKEKREARLLLEDTPELIPTRLGTIAQVRRMLERAAGAVENSSEDTPVARANALARIGSVVIDAIKAADLEKQVADLTALVQSQSDARDLQ